MPTLTLVLSTLKQQPRQNRRQQRHLVPFVRLLLTSSTTTSLSNRWKSQSVCESPLPLMLQRPPPPVTSTTAPLLTTSGLVLVTLHTLTTITTSLPCHILPPICCQTKTVVWCTQTSVSVISRWLQVKTAASSQLPYSSSSSSLRRPLQRRRLQRLPRLLLKNTTICSSSSARPEAAARILVSPIAMHTLAMAVAAVVVV